MTPARVHGVPVRVRTTIVAAMTLLAACAEVPPTPTPAASSSASAVATTSRDQRVDRAIARHRELAQQSRQAGDLAVAAVQWQILTVLDPTDASFQTELADTRAAISGRVKEAVAQGNGALKNGDADRAADAMLRVLALDPENAEAAQTLRDIEKRRAVRIQASRAAKANEATGGQRPAMPAAAGARATPTDAADAYGLEQPLEMFKAGDVTGGLRDLRVYVDANPGDKAGRQRIGTTVWDRGRELEGQGQREQALTLYEQAVSLRGEPAFGWSAKIQTLKKSLSDEYFERGVKAYPADPAAAARLWESALRFDPQNSKAAARLKESKPAADKAPADKAPSRGAK